MNYMNYAFWQCQTCQKKGYVSDSDELLKNNRDFKQSYHSDIEEIDCKGNLTRIYVDFQPYAYSITFAERIIGTKIGNITTEIGHAYLSSNGYYERLRTCSEIIEIFNNYLNKNKKDGENFLILSRILHTRLQSNFRKDDKSDEFIELEALLDFDCKKCGMYLEGKKVQTVKRKIEGEIKIIHTDSKNSSLDVVLYSHNYYEETTIHFPLFNDLNLFRKDQIKIEHSGTGTYKIEEIKTRPHGIVIDFIKIKITAKEEG